MSFQPSQGPGVYKHLLNENLVGRCLVISTFCEHYTKYSYTLPPMNSLSTRTNNVTNSKNNKLEVAIPAFLGYNNVHESISKPQEFANIQDSYSSYWVTFHQRELRWRSHPREYLHSRNPPVAPSVIPRRMEERQGHQGDGRSNGQGANEAHEKADEA